MLDSFRSVSSLTLIPVPYKTSIIVLFLCPNSESRLTEEINLFISSSVRTSGNLFSIFGLSISFNGDELISPSNNK